MNIMYKSHYIKAATVSVQWRHLLEAIETDNHGLVKTILASGGGWPSDDSCTDYEALILAIRLGRKSVAHQLLDHNCRVFCDTAGTATNNTPLHYAVHHHDWTDLIERLLERGCRVSDANASGKTAVHVAFKVNATERDIDFLLQRYLGKSRDNVVSKDGLSTLHVACTRPDAEIVEKLVDADPSLIDQPIFGTKHRPLHYAVKNRRHRVARVLLDRGANIYKRDAEGSTPLHWALWTRDVRMIDLILTYDERKENVVNKFGLSHFMASCAGSNVDRVAEYVEMLCSGTTLCPRDLMSTRINKLGSYSGYTPLHFAAEFGGCNDIARLLLQYGAECCATTCHQLTPHSLAVLRGHEAIARILRKHCCDKRSRGDARVL